MAELSEEIKLEIVTRLARFEIPADITKDLQARGIETYELQVGRYDPTRSYYEGGDKWREIFEKSRQLYIQNVSAVPIANQTYRLEVLQRGVAAAMKNGKWTQAAQLAAQAAGEVGGQFTNERNVNLNDARRPNPRDLSPEERATAFSELVRKALEGMQQAPGVEPQHGSVQ